MWSAILLGCRFCIVPLWVVLLASSTIASEMNTLMGVKGKDFVLLGGDSAFFRSVVVMEDDYRKVVELADNMVVAASGDQGDVEMFVEWLKRNAFLMRLESSRPVGVQTLANFARRSLAGKIRQRGGGEAVSALLGGWNEVAGVAELFWLDSLGSLQSVPFGAHGLSSRFALSLLDAHYMEGMTLPEAKRLMEECFRQLEGRFLVSSVGFSMKVVDRHGCRSVDCERVGRVLGGKGIGGQGGGDGGSGVGSDGDGWGGAGRDCVSTEERGGLEEAGAGDVSVERGKE